MKKEKLTAHNELKTIIKEKIGIDTSNFPNIFSILKKKHSLSKIGQPHTNLYTSKNLKPNTISDSRIISIWYQKVKPKNGIVAEHDHNKENISEIIILDSHSNYANLPTPIHKIGNYNIHFIKSDIKHGSNKEASYGNWVSIKVKL